MPNATLVTIALLTIAFCPLLASGTARADQVVVTDVTYEHSATTTTDSHYRVDPSAETPADLTAPVDYASGMAYVRLEVFTKPAGDEPTRFQICFEARPTYACTDQAPAYTTTGVYTWATPFSSFYQGDMVDWSMGTGRIALILKDTMNQKPSPENVGEAYSALFMPTMIRVTVTLVSPGATYVDPTAWTGADAGVTPADDGGGVVDADGGVASGSDGGLAGPADGGGGTRADAGPTSSDDVDGGCSIAARKGASPRTWGALALACMVLVTFRRVRRSSPARH